jgi:hypothetical protein
MLPCAECGCTVCVYVEMRLVTHYHGTSGAKYDAMTTVRFCAIGQVAVNTYTQHRALALHKALAANTKGCAITVSQKYVPTIKAV